MYFKEIVGKETTQRRLEVDRDEEKRKGDSRKKDTWNGYC